METMIALMIFSIGIVGIGAMHTSSMAMNAKARRWTCNSTAVAAYLEFILRLPFDDPLLQDPDNGFEPSTPDHGPFRIESTASTIEWEIVDQFPVPDTKRVCITLRSGSTAGVTQSYSWEYIKARGVN